MKRQVLIFLVALILVFSIAYGFLMYGTGVNVLGEVSTKLPGRCEIIQFGRCLQPVHTVVLASPMMEMIRLGLLPMQHTWFEDGRRLHNWNSAQPDPPQ